MSWNVMMETVPEVLALLAERRQAVLAGRVAWGSWRYDPAAGVLHLDPRITGDVKFYVPLTSCMTSVRTLDIIAEVARRSWATAKIVGHLVLALDELLNLRRSLCGGGVEHGPIDVLRILRT